MRLACLILLLLTSLTLLPAPARAACDGAQAPAITVRIDRPPVQEDRSIGLMAMDQMPNDSKRPGMEAYDHTLGLTETEIRDSKVHLELDTTNEGAGVYCSRLRSADYAMTWRTIVHIVAEIRPGSCLEREVVAHEQGHVHIDETLIPVARRAIEIALTSVAEQGVTGSSVQESQQRFQEQATAAVRDALTIFTVVRRRQQLAHDTKEEYDRLSEACGPMEYLRLLRDAHKKAGVNS